MTNHHAIYPAAVAYIGAYKQMCDAMSDGINVQGAASAIEGAADNLRETLAPTLLEADMAIVRGAMQRGNGIEGNRVLKLTISEYAAMSRIIRP